MPTLDTKELLKKLLSELAQTTYKETSTWAQPLLDVLEASKKPSVDPTIARLEKKISDLEISIGRLEKSKEAAVVAPKSYVDPQVSIIKCGSCTKLRTWNSVLYLNPVAKYVCIECLSAKLSKLPNSLVNWILEQE